MIYDKLLVWYGEHGVPFTLCRPCFDARAAAGRRPDTQGYLMPDNSPCEDCEE